MHFPKVSYCLSTVFSNRTT